MAKFKFDKNKRPTQEMVDLLRKCGSIRYDEAMAAQRAFAEFVTGPIREGVIDGDITGDIFMTEVFQPDAAIEYPIDPVPEGRQRDFEAYAMPSHGKIPDRKVEGDYLAISTFDTGNSIDTNLKYLRAARWPLMARLLEVLEGGHVYKNNKDAFFTIIAAGNGRNLVVSDDLATAGLFTKRLVSNAEIIMARNAGGNTASPNRGRLTDVLMSVESHADVLSWDLTQIPEAIRQQIFSNWGASGLTKIGPVTLHSLTELGAGQLFDDYYTATLGGTFPNSKTELAIGLDLSKPATFVRPVRQELEVTEDPTFHRRNMASWYSRMEGGWGVLSSLQVLLLAI